MFGPPIPASALFSKNSAFTKFLLTKIINAENAAHRSDKFVSMATRTRQEYLKDLATNYATQTTIDSGSKFGEFVGALSSQPASLPAITKYKQNKIRQAQAGPGNISHLISVSPLSFSLNILFHSIAALFAPKKKMTVRPRFSPDASLRGALSWAVMVEDCSSNTQIESFIAISSDSLVIIQDNPHRDILFICPCK